MSIARAPYTVKTGSNPLISSEQDTHLDRFPSHDRDSNLPSKLSGGLENTEIYGSYFNTITVVGNSNLESMHKLQSEASKAPLHNRGTYYTNFLKDSAPLRHGSNSPKRHPNSADPSKFATVQHNRFIDHTRFEQNSLVDGATVKTEQNSRPPSVSYLQKGYRSNIPQNPASLKSRMIM
jgi:hypothetical protein